MFCSYEALKIFVSTKKAQITVVNSLFKYYQLATKVKILTEYNIVVSLNLCFEVLTDNVSLNWIFFEKSVKFLDLDLLEGLVNNSCCFI